MPRGALTQPAFLPEEVDLERDIVYEEIDMGHPHVDDVTFETLLYGDHPIARPIGGDLERFDEIEREDLIEWYERHYRAENVVVAWSGSVSPEHVSRRVEEAFAALPGDWEAPPREPPDLFTGRQLFGVEYEEGSAWLMAGHHVEPGGARELAALLVLQELMGERVFDELRVERGLTYAPGVTSRVYSDTWRIQSFVVTSDGRALGDVLEGLEAVYASFADVDARRFERARESVRERLDSSALPLLAENVDRAWLLSRAGAETLDVRAALEALDRCDLAAFADEALRSDHAFVLTNSGHVFGTPVLVIVLCGLLVLGMGGSRSAGGSPPSPLRSVGAGSARPAPGARARSWRRSTRSRPRRAAWSGSCRSTSRPRRTTRSTTTTRSARPERGPRSRRPR